MKAQSTVCMVVVGLAVSGPIFAQTATNPPPYNPNRIGLNGRFWFNVTADFKNVGAFPRRTDSGPATGGGLNRNYDDGYNRLDGSGNFQGLTWNWGYNNASQIRGDGTPEGVVLMNSSVVSPAGKSKNVEDDPQYGVELTYARRIGSLGKGTWGFETGIGYTDLSIKDGRTVSGNITRITDAFSLGGIVAPLPPHMGTFAGPGPVISDSPTRTSSVVPGGAVTTAKREFEAEVYSLRLGPYYEIPVWKRLSVLVSGGLALLAVDGDYRSREATTIADGGTFSRADNGSKDDVLVGGYVGAGLSLSITDSIGLFTGVQYQNVGRFTQRAGSKEANIDFGKSVIVSAGVGISF